MTTREEKIGVLQARAIDLGAQEIGARYARTQCVKGMALTIVFAALDGAALFDAHAGCGWHAVATVAMVGNAALALLCAWRAVVWHGRHAVIAEKSRAAHQAFYRGAS